MFAERLVAVGVPFIAAANVLAYCYARGWGDRFSIPDWLVSVDATSVLTISIAALIAAAIVLGITIASRRWAEPHLTDDQLEVTIPENSLYWIVGFLGAGFLIGMPSFWSLGNNKATDETTWSFINTQCVIVATFGDKVVAADFDRRLKTVAPEFTVYSISEPPAFWQAHNLRIGLKAPDSETLWRRQIECPGRDASAKPEPSLGGHSKPASPGRSKIGR